MLANCYGISRGSSGEYAVRYLPIHEKLVSLACDVLVILDCCEATDVLDKAISSPSQVLPGQKKFVCGLAASIVQS